MLTLTEIAAKLNLSYLGSERDISGVATLAKASAYEISFFANNKYRAQLRETTAAAVLLKATDADSCLVPALISKNPYADFARVAQLFSPLPIARPGIHASAVIEAGAQIHPQAQIDAQVFVASTAVIEQGAIIGAQSFVGPDCVVGAFSTLHARATLVKKVRLGRCVIVHSGAVLGADGFGFAPDAGQWLKVPQLGGVIIGDGCDIGANTTIDCGALEDTVLGHQVKLDNQIQVGHNVRIGDFTAIAGCTAIAGSTTIGARCLIAGGVGIAGHLQICDDVSIMAMSLVTGDISEKGVYAGAMPLMPQREWRKNAVHLRRLDGTLRAHSFAHSRADHD
jgi:UDP-3-O-[3-hydroxymyristoyl] glucosamine N-acyltransferase